MEGIFPPPTASRRCAAFLLCAPNPDGAQRTGNCRSLSGLTSCAGARLSFGSGRKGGQAESRCHAAAWDAGVRWQEFRRTAESEVPGRGEAARCGETDIKAQAVQQSWIGADICPFCSPPVPLPGGCSQKAQGCHAWIRASDGRNGLFPLRETWVCLHWCIVSRLLAARRGSAGLRASERLFGQALERLPVRIVAMRSCPVPRRRNSE